MTEESPLPDAQQKFVDAIPFRHSSTESCKLTDALGRTLYDDIISPTDIPAYPKVIVEGFLVNSADTQGASESAPISFKIVGDITPSDTQCPTIESGMALRVSTGSIASDGPIAVVRQWEAQLNGDDGFSITRPLPPRFFIEEQGCDLKKNSTALNAGDTLTPLNLGTLATLGLNTIEVTRKPRITIFASGDEVVPYTEPLQAGTIRDCNSIMLAGAVTEAGGIPVLAGIMKDDFDGFVKAATLELKESDMLLISGGTAIGGRDFIADLVKELGTLVIDGVPMRSGKPLIMGIAGNKPIVCVAGHPPEALRGFMLFGVAAINRLLGKQADPPPDSP